MPKANVFDETTVLTKKEQAKVKDLCRVIAHLRHLHGNGEPCIHPDNKHLIPDSEFDAMVKELERFDPESLKDLGNLSAADYDPNAKKIKHDPPMTSINKANGTLEEKQAEVEKWFALIGKELKLNRDEVVKRIVVSYKHDGCAVRIRYKDGKLVEAGLRPNDGINGEDVTANVKFIKNVPPALPQSFNFVLCGEVECQIDTFKRLNESVAVDGRHFACARNYATGSIRQFKDPTVTQKRELSFTGYNIIGFEKPPYKTKRERAIWVNKTLGIPFIRVEFYSDSILEELETKVPELNYQVDGAVLELDSFEDSEQMGTYGNQSNSNPRAFLAWKFEDETADPELKKHIWQVGRTGVITPVCTFDDVPLAGAMLGKASAHSLGFLVRNNIHEGDKIRIRRSGAVIPEVMGKMVKGKFIEKVDASDDSLPKTFDLTKFDFPKKCPSCGTDTIVEKGSKHGLLNLVCVYQDCPARNVGRFINYLEKFDVKGLGAASIEPLVETGLIREFSDLYTLTVSDFKSVGFSMRESLLAVANINMVDAPEQQKDNVVLAKRTIDAVKRKKKITFAKFIACLGIKGASRSTGGSLAKQFGTLDALFEASEDDLKSIPNVGDKTAKSVVEFFKRHRGDVCNLKANYVEIEKPKTGRFTGKSFVFTGSPGEKGKEFYKSIVEQEGGVVKSSVSKNIDFVIIGEGSGEKGIKAKDMKSGGHPLTVIEGVDVIEKFFND